MIDVDAALDEGVGDLLVSDSDFGISAVAGAEDGPVEGGAAVGVGGFDVGAAVEDLFGLGDAGEGGLHLGLACGFVEFLDERRGVCQIELNSGRRQFFFFGCLRVGFGLIAV